MIDVSYQAMFWQCIAIVDKKNPIQKLLSNVFKKDKETAIQELDDMKNRCVDNLDFFPIYDYEALDPKRFYEEVLKEIPDWFGEATEKKIII